MALSIVSNDYNKQGFTLIDNVFIDRYLPYANENAVKVYLFGLRLALQINSDNSAENLCASLDLTPDEVAEAYRFWQEQGLVNVLSAEPLTVQYLSPRAAFSPNKKYSKDKYADFNDALQALYPTRMLDRGELERYYDFIEETGAEPMALVLIAKYCIDLKGGTIGYPYILTVARRWTSEGNKTLRDIEEKLKESESLSEELREIYRVLKKTAAPDLEARQFYLKWTKNLGFEHAAVVAAAKNVKKGGLEGLDRLLESYFKQGVYTEADIKAYKAMRDKLYELTREVVRTLSLRLESLDFSLETYIAPLISEGFDAEAVKLIARYCALTNKRNLADMAAVAEDFYKQGCITADSVQSYLDSIAKNDSVIRRIILATGFTRAVTPNDRNFYQNWSANWGFSDEEILDAAMLSEGKAYAFGYINGILAKRKTEQTPKPVTAAEKASEKLQASFAAEELKVKLREDATYRDLEREKRVTALELSRYLADGSTIPPDLDQKYKLLSEQLKDRIKQLGYDSTMLSD